MVVVQARDELRIFPEFAGSGGRVNAGSNTHGKQKEGV
jgi:hypothetical protein